jgi:hypothetical protein
VTGLAMMCATCREAHSGTFERRSRCTVHAHPAAQSEVGRDVHDYGVAQAGRLVAPCATRDAARSLLILCSSWRAHTDYVTVMPGWASHCEANRGRKQRYHAWPGRAATAAAAGRGQHTQAARNARALICCLLVHRKCVSRCQQQRVCVRANTQQNLPPRLACSTEHLHAAVRRPCAPAACACRCAGARTPCPSSHPGTCP